MHLYDDICLFLFRSMPYFSTQGVMEMGTHKQMNQISFSDSQGNQQNFNNNDFNFYLERDANRQTSSNSHPQQTMDLQTYRKMFDFLQPVSMSQHQPIKLQENKIESTRYRIQNNRQNVNKEEETSSKDIAIDEPKLIKPIALSISDKKRITNKIQQIIARRSAILTPQMQESFIKNHQSQALALENQSDFVDRKKKPPITLQLIEQCKKAFEEYNRSLQLPHHQRMTFRDVANKLNISHSLVTQLYEEHSIDPLFSNRISKVTDAYKNPCNSMFKNPTLAQLRIRFIRDLLKQNGPLTQCQIARQMSKDERLCVRDRITGKLQPIGRRAIQKLMKTGNLTPKRKLQIVQMNFNDPQYIQNRYKYAKRYLQLTEDKYSDIYFLGQFSFALMVSQSSCPPAKRDDFCDGKAPNTRHQVNSIQDCKFSVEDKANRKVQYLIVISIEGIIYYEIFANIYRDMNFPETLMNIGKSVSQRKPNKKKYLILETSFLHKKTDLQQFQRNFPVKVIFLPPLTPMLNPTQYFFMEIKSVVKSRVYKMRQSYSMVLQEVLKQYRTKSMQSYYKCINPYVELAIKHLPFK